MNRLGHLAWFSAAGVMALGLAVISLFWLAQQQEQRDADQRASARAACERSVAGREDTRSMWLYLFDQFADTPRAPLFRVELDRRLPALRCTLDNIPTPKENR